MYKIVTELNEVVKTFDSYEAAERYYNMMNGVITQFNDQFEECELYIYIKED